MTMDVIERYGNGAYIAQYRGTTFMTQKQTYRILGKHYGSGYAYQRSGGPEHGWQEPGPYLFELASTICSGQHPDHGKVFIDIPMKEIEIDGKKKRFALVVFDGKPYKLFHEPYRGWIFEPRDWTAREKFDLMIKEEESA